MEDESDEKVGDELQSVTSSAERARLTERDRKLIPEMRRCIVK